MSSVHVSGQVRTCTAGPLVFGTDGSVATRRVHGLWQTGWGYLSTHGHYGAGWCQQTPEQGGAVPSTVAELRAVACAVTPHLPQAPVAVFLDSADAVDLLAEWRSGHQRMPAGYRGSQRHTPRLLRLAGLVAAYPDNLHVCWVRSHAGHLLNEAADALARIGARRLLDRVDRNVMQARAHRLAEGFLADPRLLEQVAA